MLEFKRTLNLAEKFGYIFETENELKKNHYSLLFLISKVRGKLK